MVPAVVGNVKVYELLVEFDDFNVTGFALVFCNISDPCVLDTFPNVKFPVVSTDHLSLDNAKLSFADPIAIVSAVVLSVPILIAFPLVPVPKFTIPVVPESSVSAFAPAEVILPAPANPNAVADTEIVSTEATPVSAPAAVTFNPPFDVKANVPDAFPSERLLVPVVPRKIFPVVVPPRLSDCIRSVAKFPVAVRYIALPLTPDDTDATGVPLFNR